MSEELLGGNQTTTEQGTEQQTQVDTTQIEQTQTEQIPATTQEENYFEIKYNKEPVKVSYDEAPTYIQKGMNYDKVYENYQQTQQQLDRVARLAGYESHDQMLAQLDAIEKEQERQAYLERGLDPDAIEEVVSKKLEEHPAIKHARELEQKAEAEQKFQAEANEFFQEFPGLKPEEIQPEVWQMKEQKGLSLLDAYLRVNYKSLGQQKEQEAIQKLQGNAVSSPGSLGSGDVSHTQSVSNLSSTDFNSLVDQVLRGERKQL